MKLNPSLVLAAALSICANAALAQGTLLYTWHGNSNLFQGSFQVTPEENQPGSHFYSQTFTSSILVTSPDNTFTYVYNTGNGYPDGANGSPGPPLDLTLDLYDTLLGRRLVASAYNDWAIVTEFDMANSGQLWWENGYWTATYVPEPSTASLVTLAGIAWGIKRRSA